jgi:hypothetical protein
MRKPRHVASVEKLAAWWALEFDDVAIRVGDIDRGSFPFGAVTESSFSSFNAIGLKMTANTRFVERIDSEAEVI